MTTPMPDTSPPEETPVAPETPEEEGEKYDGGPIPEEPNEEGLPEG